MSIKDYRLTSMEEPTDAMLHELMSPGGYLCAAEFG